jgi:uncharacterized protein (TIGR03435 family)
MTLAMAAMPAASQTPAQKTQFDVASIKPNTMGRAAGPPRVAADGERFVASNASMKTVLLYAYRSASGRALRYADIIGAPDWTDREVFDIQAKADASVPSSPEQMRLRVQSLLADRFQLKAHWETREMATYNLVVAKSGVKFKSSEDQSPLRLDSQRGVVKGIGKPSPAGMGVSISGTALPIDTLVSTVQSYANRPVFDKTGLSGMFDVTLDFLLESSGFPAPTTVPSGPTLATALEEQLGLKLESSKGNVEVLVIDSVSRPTEN